MHFTITTWHTNFGQMCLSFDFTIILGDADGGTLSPFPLVCSRIFLLLQCFPFGCVKIGRSTCICWNVSTSKTYMFCATYRAYRMQLGSSTLFLSKKNTFPNLPFYFANYLTEHVAHDKNHQKSIKQVTTFGWRSPGLKLSFQRKQFRYMGYSMLQKSQ